MRSADGAKPAATPGGFGVPYVVIVREDSMLLFRRACLTCVAALAVSAGVPASAQEAAPDGTDTDYTTFNLDELTGMDVVYGAASYDQKITDAPASVTVITADEIQAHGYRTLADVLASVRGFNISYDRSYDYVGVRGFSRPGDFNTRVLLLHDGHPGNDIVYGTAAAGPEMTVDLAVVKRIEIIRGPGSVLYGAGAFFAVINLVTYDGDELGGAEVTAEYGSRGRLGGQAAWGGTVGGGGSLLLAGDAFRDEGDELYWPEYDDPATNNGVFENGDREVARHAYAKYVRPGLQATAGWVRRDKRIPTGDWGMIFNDTGAVVSDERVALDLSGDRRLSADASLRGRLSYDDYTCRGDYPYDVADEGQPLQRAVQHDEAHGVWWSGEFQASLRRGSHRFVAGADFRRSTTARQTSVVVDPFESLLDIDGTMDNAGIYVQDEWTLGQPASLYLGLRGDSYRSFGGNLTPRCGLVTRPDRRTTAKILYGEAFRAPNAYELFYGDGISQKPNPGLKPECVRTWEAVVERELSDRLRVGVCLYDNRITGLVDQIVDPDDGMIVFRNVADAYTRGVEIDVDARLMPGLRGRFSLSAQRGEEESSETPLTNAPARLVKLNLTTPRQGVALAGALEVQHVSRRGTLAGDWAPAYTVVNLDATWWTPVRGLQFDLAIDNALDERYADPGAAHQAQDMLAREGRLLTGRLGWHW
jgi:outer membrane receptor for ferrienterochelin and colicins